MYGQGCGRHAHLTQLRLSRSQPRKGTGTDCPGKTRGRNGPGHRVHLLASILLGLSTVSDTSLLWTLEPRPAFRRSSQIFYSDIRPGEIFFLEMFKRNTSVFLYKIWQTIKITQERPLLISFGRNTQIGLLLCSVALSSITTRCMHITHWLVYSNRNRFSADYLGRQVGLRPAQAELCELCEKGYVRSHRLLKNTCNLKVKTRLSVKEKNETVCLLQQMSRALQRCPSTARNSSARNCAYLGDKIKKAGHFLC